MNGFLGVRFLLRLNIVEYIEYTKQKRLMSNYDL